jgi:hypothetical protein
MRDMREPYPALACFARKARDGAWVNRLPVAHRPPCRSGSKPTFVANADNDIVVPEVFKSIKKTIAKRRAK